MFSEDRASFQIKQYTHYCHLQNSFPKLRSHYISLLNNRDTLYSLPLFDSSSGIFWNDGQFEK